MKLMTFLINIGIWIKSHIISTVIIAVLISGSITSVIIISNLDKNLQKEEIKENNNVNQKNEIGNNVTCNDGFILDENNNCIEEIKEEPKSDINNAEANNKQTTNNNSKNNNASNNKNDKTNNKESNTTNSSINQNTGNTNNSNNNDNNNSSKKDEMVTTTEPKQKKQYTVNFYKEVGKCSCDVTYTLDKSIKVDEGTTIYIPDYSNYLYYSYSDGPSLLDDNYLDDTVIINKNLNIYYHSPCGGPC